MCRVVCSERPLLFATSSFSLGLDWVEVLEPVPQTLRLSWKKSPQMRCVPISQHVQSSPLLTHLSTSTRSRTATKKPPVSMVSGEAHRQCSAPGKVLRPRWGQEGRAGASLRRSDRLLGKGSSSLPKTLGEPHYLKVPGLCCKASCTTSSFSSWQREHVE